MIPKESGWFLPPRRYSKGGGICAARPRNCGELGDKEIHTDQLKHYQEWQGEHSENAGATNTHDQLRRPVCQSILLRTRLAVTQAQSSVSVLSTLPASTVLDISSGADGEVLLSPNDFISKEFAADTMSELPGNDFQTRDWQERQALGGAATARLTSTPEQLQNGNASWC